MTALVCLRCLRATATCVVYLTVPSYCLGCAAAVVREGRRSGRESPALTLVVPAERGTPPPAMGKEGVTP